MTATAMLNPPAEPQRRRWSRDEYLRLARDGYFDGQRVELIDGEVVVMAPMGEPHVAGVSQAAQWLWHSFAGGHYVRVQAPFDAGASFTPEPDIAVVAGSPKGHTTPPAAAALIVEVAETSLAYDLGDKASLYAAAAVADYWVLDVVHGRLHVFRDPRPDAAARYGHGYFRQSINGPTDQVAPLAAAGHLVTVADLLP